MQTPPRPKKWSKLSGLVADWLSRYLVSAWHVVLSFVDLGTDIYGAVSTAFLVPYDKYLRQIPLVGASFQVCLWVQLSLIAGSLLAHAVFAAWRAAKSQPAANSSKLGSVAIAFLRGLCNMELPYQLHKSIIAADQGASSKEEMHYQAALHCRFIELVFETGQMIMSLTVLLLQLALTRTGMGLDLATWKAAGSFVSAFFGLVSLTVAATEYIRVSPRSFWAGPSPTRLFLGIIDIGSTTWVTSLLTGVYSASFLFISTFGATFSLYDSIFPGKPGNFGYLVSAVTMAWKLPEGVLIIILGVLLYLLLALVICMVFSGCCCGCWEAIGSRAVVLQASIISVFVLVPWVAVPGEGSSLDTNTPAGLRTFRPVLSMFVCGVCLTMLPAVQNVMRYFYPTPIPTNSAHQGPDPLNSYGESVSWEVASVAMVLLMTTIRRKQRDQGHIKLALYQPTYKWCTRKLSLILQSDEAIGHAL